MLQKTVYIMCKEKETVNIFVVILTSEVSATYIIIIIDTNTVQRHAVNQMQTAYTGCMRNILE